MFYCQFHETKINYCTALIKNELESSLSADPFNPHINSLACLLAHKVKKHMYCYRALLYMHFSFSFKAKIHAQKNIRSNKSSRFLAFTNSACSTVNKKSLFVNLTTNWKMKIIISNYRKLFVSLKKTIKKLIG